MEYATIDWVLFISVVLVLLFIDLYFFGRQTHKMSFRESLLTCAVWIGLALLFGVYIYWRGGASDAMDYLAGYLIEYNLSIDNLFIFIIIFSYFHVPKDYTHKVLFWGIVGAIVMRAIFIALGIVIVQKFAWVLYIFGIFLVYTGLKLLKEKQPTIDPENNPVIVLARKWIPMTDTFHGDSFFVKLEGIWKATPLFLVLLLIESTDLVFAIDSIPAVMGITLNPYLIFTSNIAAILGLRSLYFSLEHLRAKFHYLHETLALILILIGLKMLTAHWIHLPKWLTFGAIFGLLAGGIILSLLYPAKKNNID